MIRRGTTRLVLVIPPFAFKFGRGVRGKRCNKFEAKLFADVNERRRSMLCPVIWCAQSGRLLIARAATPLTIAERDDLMARDAFPDWDYMPGDPGQPFEYKPSDWGWLAGKLVALDYSAPALFNDDDQQDILKWQNESHNLS